MNTLAFPLDTVAIFGAVFVLSMLVDLYQHRRHRSVSAANAAGWSVFWIALSLGFYGWIRYRHGEHHASMFLTGYVLEKTLSIDNLMVFIAVFEFFKIHSGLQHRILYYGILGAIVFRAIFVGLGSGILIAVGPWAEIVFGLVVGWAAVKMLRGESEAHEEKEPDYEHMGLVRFFRRFYPVFPSLVGASFFIGREEAERAAAKHAPPLVLDPGVKRWMTPAFVCLLVVEGSDVLFAFDSVPAVIAVTKEPLLVYTAMIFAVLGLRSLYFLLLILTRYLVHLEKAVIVVLFFIAAKMFLGAAEHLLHVKLPFVITPTNSLVVVLGVLSLGVLASFFWPGEPVEGSPRSTAGEEDA
ncbi:MAG: TerC/Alx family metal homeostasis membrane protein [Deltaproteobacteria bacterium]|nr:TerC/Alx family metal homeostasis membrane protein [Deltaproteobacteria bacterium]